MVASEW